MKRKIMMLLAVGLVAPACSLSQDVKIDLDPDSTITIKTAADQLVGETATPVTIDPASAGSDYTDNKSHIDKVKADAILLEIVTVRPENRATQLTDGSVTLTNLRTSEVFVLTLNAPIAIAQGTTTTVSAFTPDPTDFLTEILQNADKFTVSAKGTVDQAPVDIDVKIPLKITLTIKAF